MRRKQVYSILWCLVLILNFGNAESICVHEKDSMYMTLNEANAIFDSSRCSWMCKSQFTGNACTTPCSSTPPQCPSQYRIEACDAPHDTKCVLCREEPGESELGSFAFAPATSGIHSEILKDRGSFEYSKLYPNALVPLNAREAVSPTVTKSDDCSNTSSHENFLDIMFTGFDLPITWHGKGAIQVQFMESAYQQGARNSDVYLKMSPECASLSVCGIKPLITMTPRGYVFEFMYRQLVVYEEDIIFNVKLSKSLKIPLPSLNKQPRLPSSSIWTQYNGVFDDSDTDAIISSPYASTNGVCITLEFQMKRARILLLDDFRVFDNLIWNGEFENLHVSSGSNSKSWTRSTLLPDNTIEFERTNGDTYARMAFNSAFKQILDIKTSTGGGGVLAGVIKFNSRGQGIISVTYKTCQTLAMNCESTMVVFKEMVYKDIENKLDPTWYHMKIPFNIKASNQFHEIEFQNVVERSGADVDSTDEIHVDSVAIFVDDQRCPVGPCDDLLNSFFVNGQCETCFKKSDVKPLCVGVDQRVVGCRLNENHVKVAICGACQSVTDSDMTGFFVSDIQSRECTFQCRAGKWFSRDSVDTAGKPQPTCKVCSDVPNCYVGQRVQACGHESDAVCVPCTATHSDEVAVVYKRTSEDTCNLECTPNFFSPSGTTSSCFACSEFLCGADEIGFSSLRIIAGLQYTSKCTRNEDSKCHLCASNDNHVRFTRNGNIIGGWCQYECSPGFQRCSTCTWDDAEATRIFPSSADTALLLYGYVRTITGSIPMNKNLVVRFRGRVKLLLAQTEYEVELRVKQPTGSAETVLRVFPIVPPSVVWSFETAANIRNAPAQNFDVIVDFRHLWSPPLTTYNLTWEWRQTLLGNEFRVEEMTIDILSISNATDCCNRNGRWRAESVPPIHESDPASLTRCRPCSNVKPVNATWNSPDDCTWTCNTDNELKINGAEKTCRYCPDPKCLPGFYWAECGVCKPCVAAPAHAVFAGPGTIRYDNSSCPIICLPGFWYESFEKICKACNTPTELNCGTKEHGPFFEMTCSAYQNSKCVNCYICPLGSNASTPCSASKDTVCTDCDTVQLNMPALQQNGGGAIWRLGLNPEDYCEWECAPGLIHNSVDNTCIQCNNDRCGIGYYPTECNVENNFNGCLKCEAPKNAAIISIGKFNMSQSCRWRCGLNEDYNATRNECVSRPDVVLATIAVTNTHTRCMPSICGWGRHIAPSLSLEIDDATPCELMCSNCTPLSKTRIDGILTESAVYTRKGSCDWVCSYKFMRVDDKCVLVEE